MQATTTTITQKWMQNSHSQSPISPTAGTKGKVPKATTKKQKSSPQGVASHNVFSTEKKEQQKKQPSIGQSSPMASHAAHYTAYYQQPTPESIRDTRLHQLEVDRQFYLEQETQRYDFYCSTIPRDRYFDESYASLTQTYESIVAQINENFYQQQKYEYALYEQACRNQAQSSFGPQHVSPYIPNAHHMSQHTMSGHLPYQTPQGSPMPMMGMAPLGNSGPQGIPFCIPSENITRSQSLSPQAHGKISAALQEAGSLLALASGSVSKEKKANPVNTADTLPPATTTLVRLTSDGQTMTDAVGKFTTPTTAHILSQVPANYPDLLNALETAITASGVNRYLSSEGVRDLMVTINDDIVRSFYSQVTDREGYSASATPSPTTLLTVLHEARAKSNIKGMDHAQKLGRILKKIQDVMVSLKAIRDGQAPTQAGVKAAEISRLFVAFFNKIGMVGVSSLEIYETKFKKVNNVDIPSLKSCFEQEAAENEDVFHFYIEQTEQKKLVSQTMTPKKIKFREDVQRTTNRLNAPIQLKGLSMSELVENAASSGKKLSQSQRKKQEKKSTDTPFIEKSPLQTPTSLALSRVSTTVPASARSNMRFGNGTSTRVSVSEDQRPQQSTDTQAQGLDASFEEDKKCDIQAAFEDFSLADLINEEDSK